MRRLSLSNLKWQDAPIRDAAALAWALQCRMTPALPISRRPLTARGQPEVAKWGMLGPVRAQPRSAAAARLMGAGHPPQVPGSGRASLYSRPKSRAMAQCQWPNLVGRGLCSSESDTGRISRSASRTPRRASPKSAPVRSRLHAPSVIGMLPESRRETISSTSTAGRCDHATLSP